MSNSSAPQASVNIILTGFMGTGKTTVGRLIAGRLGMEFVDTDAEIERVHGPIPQLFADRGENHFRALEHELVIRLIERADPLVIATGGGTLVDPENAVSLTGSGPVYTLTVDPAEIVRRVVADGPDDRPLLAGAPAITRVEELMAKRSSTYDRFVQIRTDGRTPDEIADEIICHTETSGFRVRGTA